MKVDDEKRTNIDKNSGKDSVKGDDKKHDDIFLIILVNLLFFAAYGLRQAIMDITNIFIPFWYWVIGIVIVLLLILNS